MKYRLVHALFLSMHVAFDYHTLYFSLLIISNPTVMNKNRILVLGTPDSDYIPLIQGKHGMQCVTLGKRV